MDDYTFGLIQGAVGALAGWIGADYGPKGLLYAFLVSAAVTGICIWVRA